jgi:hypothetical protein
MASRHALHTRARTVPPPQRSPLRRPSTRRWGAFSPLLVALAFLPSSTVFPAHAPAPPPPAHGYFKLHAPRAPLPTQKSCRHRVHRSAWEPRPDNVAANHRMPDVKAVHKSFARRPRAAAGVYSARWDRFLLPRVTGHFRGTTDEIFQWAACKWNLSDNLLRAIAVRESTWFQYEVYPSGRPVKDWGSGDVFAAPQHGSRHYCDMLASHGRDYQRDYGDGRCPRTFGIVGVMSWSAPSWDFDWSGWQNGSFPFNRNSTAFAVDYLAASLWGCYRGWEWWLTRKVGHLWGCVGAWYAGNWHSRAANGYISRVKHEMAVHRWLRKSWPAEHPPCSPAYGCPTGT